MRPIISIASTTLGEAIRRKVLLIILLIGILFLVIAPGLGVLSARSETTVLRGMLLGVIQLTSAVIAVVLTVYMIPNEIERRTIYTILSKPVQRWQFLIGKYLGAVLSLGLMMVLMTTVMAFTFYLQQRDFTAVPELVKAPVMYFVQMSLLGARRVLFDVRRTAGQLLPFGRNVHPWFAVQSVLPDLGPKPNDADWREGRAQVGERDSSELRELQRPEPDHQPRTVDRQ